MNKKFVLTVFFLACLSTTMLPVQLKSGESISQGCDLDLYEPWHVSGTLILDWSVYPWRTVCFWDCSGFIIDADNTLLDLNGHTMMFKQAEMGPGPTGIEVKGKSRVTIRNGTIIGFQFGIWVEGSSEVNIAFNNVSGSTKKGIGIRNSKDIDIAFNNASASGEDGIGIDGDSFDVSILNNNVSESGDVGVGVYENSFDVSILNNTVTDNDREGIHLKDSNHNIVSGNKISENGYYGIYTYDSDNNTVSGNTLSDNRPGGIYIEKVKHSIFSNNTISNNPKGLQIGDSTDNIVYHNNFVDNEKHVENLDSKNVWDVGYGGEEDISYAGNYWDDHVCEDEYSGPEQNEPGSDGICDTPYIIDANNRDRYPLTDPWGLMFRVFDVTWKLYDGVRWTNITRSTAAFSNSVVTSFNFDKTLKQISFSVSKGTFCNVIIPKDLLDGAFTVLIDDIPTASILNWDETHHFINFVLGGDNHEVKITGEIVTRIVGDSNGDGEVNIIDISMAATNFRMKTGE